jgi:hypothetical protein
MNHNSTYAQKYGRRKSAGEARILLPVDHNSQPTLAPEQFALGKAGEAGTFPMVLHVDPKGKPTQFFDHEDERWPTATFSVRHRTFSRVKRADEIDS